MGLSFGASSSRQKFPAWTAPLTRYAFEGNYPEQIDPRGTGLMSDALAGSNAFPGYDAFGGLAGQVPGAQLAGRQAQQLGADATNQGYGNLMTLAGQGFEPYGNVLTMSRLAPQGLDASNYFLSRGAMPGVQGTNVMGAQGAGQQVVDAALGAYKALPPEAYARVVQEGLPEVRASYSARGLGTSGEAARGEQDYIQRTRDALHQQDVANQIAALQAGAGASGAAASQAIGAQNAAIGRGQLGLQSSYAPGSILGQFQDVAGAPLGAATQLAGLQGLPLSLAGQGLDLYSQGLQLPLAYQQALYNFTRQPQTDLLGALAGTLQGNSKSWNFGGSAGKSGGGGN